MLRPQGTDFNVIVAPGGPYSDVDVSVRFMPISGKEDASGGIVFRFSEGKYYVVRANASKITLGSITTTTGGANSPRRQSNRLHLGSGTRYKWLLSLITSGPILTANFCLIIVGFSLSVGISVYGQKPIA